MSSRASRPENLVPVIAVVVTALTFALVPVYTDASLKTFDVYNTFQIVARLGLLALALGLTMIAGEFDLSVVGMYALGGMLTVQAGQHHYWVGVLAAVGAGAAIGLVQGCLIAGLRIPSVPVTLATYITLLGLTNALSGGLTKSYPNAAQAIWVDDRLLTFFSARSLVTVGLFVVAAATLTWTRWGRELRAIGGDRRASRTAGVGVDRLIVGTFLVSGALSALGGSMLSLSLGSANPDPGVQPLILAAAAALLGGVSLAGGRGTPLGLLGGIVAVALLAEVATVAALPSYVTQLFYAALLGVIVVVDAPGLHDGIVRLRAQRRFDGARPHPSHET
jgi:ribose/xylose/arabinose/galactoside ABC-type transport system permease subunit